MIASLDGAHAKLAWAKRHFDVLQAEIATSGYGDAIRIDQEFDPNTSTIELTLQGVAEDLPIEWSLLAADFVQNLRCALNYLAWELARWNLERQGQPPEPKSVVQFPINTRGREFDAYRLADVHPDHVARIQALQPNGADHLSTFEEQALRSPHLPVEVLAARHPLAQLVNLTNDDKHRVLPAVLTVTRRSEVGNYVPIDCEIVHTNVFIQLALENGAKWASIEVRPTGPEPKVEVNDRIVPGVSFGGSNTDADLPMIGQAATEIVGEFAPIF